MPLTIHHLHYSQSERLPFLAEELCIPYTLHTYDRSPLLAPADLKALHPTGTAPVITDSSTGLTLAESGACMEYLAHRYAGGRLFLRPEHKDYASFLFWFHWANSSFQAIVGRGMTVRAALRSAPDSGGESGRWITGFVEGKLLAALGMLERNFQEGEGKTWVAGEEFTAADVMLVFSLTTMRYFCPYGLGDFPAILAYLGRVAQRDGYRRAMEKCEPGMELVLGAEAPEKSFV